MKFWMIVAMVAAVGLVAHAGASPNTLFDFEGDNHKHSQTGDAGDKVEGSYSWTSPEGVEFFVKYVADENGYRVLDSNAVPVSSWGARADGNQGSFVDYEGEGGGAKH
nr:cuticular protein 47Eg-like [Procambarus clarkii]